MASISTSDGKRVIQFVCPDKKRRTIRIGRCSMRNAQAVKAHIESMIAASITGDTPSPKTTLWLQEIGDALHERLAASGLVSSRRSTVLGAFLDDYNRDRKDVKASTRLIWSNTIRNLNAYFGEDRRMANITPLDADQWRRWLDTDQGLAINTIRRRTGLARQFFRAAVRGKLIDDNPFADLDCGVRSNRDKVRFITRETTARIMDQCPDAQWRLILALSRFGGLRCPSEHLALKWSDIDWEAGRFTVRASKTEHCESGGIRVVPIWPELEPHLRETFEQAEPGVEPVITRYRDPKQNLRRMLYKLIDRAGLKPWPKIFQNMRSTRQTELADDYPSHVVCYWMGNSETVAREHYLQVPEHHYLRACSALQNPTQFTPVGDGPPCPESKKTAVQDPTGPDGGSQVGATGRDPSSVNACVRNILAHRLDSGAAESGAVDLESHFRDFLSLKSDTRRRIAELTALIAREESHANR